MDITAGEKRLLCALCASDSPLGATPLGLAKVLAVTTTSVAAFAKGLERKGLCRRERAGMRIYLRASDAGHALNVLYQGQVTPISVVSPLGAAPAVDAEEAVPASVPAVWLQDSQASILAAVARGTGAIATSRLVELTGLTNRAVHRQATRLYAKGFLARTREERRWLWALTNKGRLQIERERSGESMNGSRRSAARASPRRSAA